MRSWYPNRGLKNEQRRALKTEWPNKGLVWLEDECGQGRRSQRWGWLDVAHQKGLGAGPKGLDTRRFIS